MSEKTPAQKMMSQKRGAPDSNKPLKTTVRLPVGKVGRFATGLTKIKTDPNVVEAYRDRKVSLFSAQDFRLMNTTPLDRLFGSLTIR